MENKEAYLNELYFIKVWLCWGLGPDRNSGSGPVPVPVEFGPVPVDLADIRPVP